MSSKITPASSLLVGWPEGFDEAGRHVLNDVGEFKLVEMWFPGGPQIVEYSSEIRVALDQARFFISDARDGITTPHERVMLASALYSLYIAARDGLNHPWFASRLRETLGKAIVEVMQARDVECAIDSCAAMFRAALRSVAVASGALLDKHSQRRRKPKPEVVAILEGERIFRETGERPSKSKIRAAMESQGIVFKGKNAASRWREIFARAGLQNLPG